MTVSNRAFRYAFPRAEEYLALVMGSIINSLRNGNPTKLTVSPLVQRAYTIVNETGLMPYKEYPVDTKFLGGV
jgi:hypothetical protein